MYAIVLDLHRDRNTLPYVHVMLVFIAGLCAKVPHPENGAILRRLLGAVPWKAIVLLLNYLSWTARYDQCTEKHILKPSHLSPLQTDESPLPEDHLMQGLLWCRDYFPSNYLINSPGDDSKRFEQPSTHTNRVQRILRIAIDISRVCPRYKSAVSS